MNTENALTLAALLAYMKDEGIDPAKTYILSADGELAADFEFLDHPGGGKILTAW